MGCFFEKYQHEFSDEECLRILANYSERCEAAVEKIIELHPSLKTHSAELAKIRNACKQDKSIVEK